MDDATACLRENWPEQPLSVSPYTGSGVSRIVVNEPLMDVVCLGKTGPILSFDEILAPEFYCSNPDKSLVDCAAFLEQTANPVAIKNLQAHDVKIRIMRDFAILHAATSYTTSVGQQARGRYTDCWAKQNGKWLTVSAHVTR
jgi:Domain of unknown function (DUF4440)